MAFAYSTSIQDRIALSVFGVLYSGLTTAQKTHIDGVWTSGALATGMAFDALTRITNIANWFEMAGATSAPQVWEGWLVAETAAMLAPVYRPERQATLELQREKAIDSLLDSFTLRDPTGTFASTNDSQKVTVQGIRYYVLNHCARRKESGVNSGLRRRIFPPIDEIDSHIQSVLTNLYNGQKWNFRKRDVTVTLNYLAYPTAATWTESTLTLTQTGAFSTITAPAILLIQSGTNVVTGQYHVASSTSDTLVLTASIAATNGNLSTGDIAGKVCSFDFRGLLSGETFDSVASRKLFYAATGTVNPRGTALEWADSTLMDQLQVSNGTYTGRPTHFRSEIQPIDKYRWRVTPFPDQSYVLKGAVFVKGPGSPSSVTDTTAFTRFPSEFGPVIRDMVLARVLKAYGASDAERFWGMATDQMMLLLPTFTDQGNPTRQTSTDDVYRDVDTLLTGSAFPASGGRYGWLGGGLT